MRRLIRPLTAAAAAMLALVLAATPAGAHTVWEPATAAPGSVVDLTLVLADEEPDGSIVQVDVQFPQPITVAALPEVPGWTATLADGEVGGGPATGVSWTGGPAPGDLELPITLGPLPSEPGRLQFPTVQTYDNGVVASWIQAWPEGAPEPDNPNPVLDLVPGGPGSIPPSTTTASTTTTTEPPTTTATAGGEDGEDDEAAAPPGEEGSDDDDGGGSALPIVIAALVALALAAGGAYALVRVRGSSTASGTAASDGPAGAPPPATDGAEDAPDE